MSESTLKTYVIAARYRFDVLYFQVEAETPENAEKIIEQLEWEYEDKKSMPYIYEKHPQIKDFAIEEDELDFGARYFEISGYHRNGFTLSIDKDIMAILLSLNDEFPYGIKESDLSVSFSTKEELDVILNNALATLGDEYTVKVIRNRAFVYYIVKKEDYLYSRPMGL